MPLILRVDVDKPFGNSSFINAVRSKLSENIWYPKAKFLNGYYLKELADFLEECNKEKISGYFYFRICTTPNQNIVNLMKIGGHHAGLHAENTRDFEAFKAEWENFAKGCELELGSFSKHGSGKLKLGKHHYAPYEPDKYITWAKKLGVAYRFGNELCTTCNDFTEYKDFYPKIFWIERDYRDESFSKLEDLIECAKNNLVPVLIHPSNYASTEDVKKDFSKLIELAKTNNVEWIL